MGLQEFLKVKKFTYKQYLAYLKKKYGAVPYRYGNKKNHKTGLFIHHDKEDEVPSLSHSDNRKEYPEYQAPEFLTYCDYLEHLLLHIMIGREANPELNLGLNGPCKYILPAIINYYKEGIRNTKWDPEYYTALDGKKAIFDDLLAEYNELVKAYDIVASENKLLYLEAKEMLATKNRALIVLGTGLGKTNTAAQIFKDWQCKVLVIGPNNVIKKDWKEKFGDWVDTITYKGFSNNYETVPYSQYGFIILDEVHHAGYDEELGKGATTWGKAIKYLAAHNIKILGLTATPDRSDGIMLGETLFKDCVCRGRTIDEAIENNQVHKFSYITSVYDTDGITDNLKKLGWHSGTTDPERIKLEGQLDLALNDIPAVSNVLITNMPKNKRKGYVFIQDKSYVQDALSILHKPFPNEDFREFYNSLSKDEIRETLKWFKETDHGFLVAINMINEGAHYDGVNTIIMFRKTESYVLYSQQIGRLVIPTEYNGKLIDNPNGIVFDLVNNINTIRYNDRVKDPNKPSLPRELSRALSQSREAKSGQIIVHDYCQDFVERYKALRNYASVGDWEEWELTILVDNYETIGSKGCQKLLDKEWKKRYSSADKHRRTIAAITCMAHQFGLKDYTYSWPEPELNILRTYYEVEGRDICKRLPNRSWRSIRAMADYYGLKMSRDAMKCKPWLPEYVEILHAKYSKVGRHIPELLAAGYTKDQIDQKARREGLIFDNHMPWSKWNDEKDNFLKSIYDPSKSRQEIIDLFRTQFPNTTHTDQAIKARLKTLRLSNKDNVNSWSAEEDLVIQQEYAIYGTDLIIRYPELFKNRTRDTIKARARKFKIKKL